MLCPKLFLKTVEETRGGKKRVVKKVRVIWQPKARSYYPRSSLAPLTETKKADPQTSPKIMATERRRQKPLSFLFHNFLPPLEHFLFTLNPPPFFFVIWSPMKFHSFSCEANDSLAEMEQGRHCSAGVLPLGSLRKEQRRRGRRAQWQFGGSSHDCRIPQIRLAEVSENEAGIWEASQRSFDGCWPVSLITYSSVSGVKRTEVFFFNFCLVDAKVNVM